MTPRVLVVDDDAGVRYTIRGLLEDAGMHVEDAPDGRAAAAILEDKSFDLVVADLRMPGMDGVALLRWIKARPGPHPRFILVTAHGSERRAVEAMKAGAYDYFRKPFDVDELLAVVERAVEVTRLSEDNQRLRAELNLARGMTFTSDAMRRLAVLVHRLGPRDVTVLITGESGTGKERLAEAIVRASGRADRPFVRFNCAALSGDLMEAELFGHSRGAFTGADRARPGLFRAADGGTLLLDEVAELAPAAQARLLRVLQEGEVRPVGEARPVRVDVRVLAATHQDLSARVAAGAFRADLYYRLNVVPLRIPPLRERPEDIPPLVRHFLERFTQRFGTGPIPPPPGLVERLAARPWPGNVRELENCVEMLVALSADGALDLSLLDANGAPPATLGLKDRVEAFERGALAEALRAAGGNRSQAAQALGISRVTLYDKIKKYGLT